MLKKLFLKYFSNRNSFNHIFSNEISKYKVIYQEDDQIESLFDKNNMPIIKNGQVTLIYFGKTNQKVYFVSELSSWKANRNNLLKEIKNQGIYHISIKLPTDSRLEYKFFVDNNWVLDSNNPNKCLNGIGSENSFIEMSEYKKSQIIQFDSESNQGKVETVNFTSDIIPDNRKIFIYLPYKYNESKKYNTIYVHDGEDYMTRAKTINTLNNLIYQKIIEPVICIFINPIDRLDEYIYNINYSKLIVDEIIPFVDRNYSTSKIRSIIGASLGGIISFYTAYNYPKYFRNIGGQSSSFIYFEDELTNLIRMNKSKFNIYIDIGRFESLIYSNRRVAKLLVSKKINLKYNEINQGHTWNSWSENIINALIFFDKN